MPITYTINPHDRHTMVYGPPDTFGRSLPIGMISAPRVHPNRMNPNESNWTIATPDGLIRWSRPYQPPHSIVCAILAQHV